MKVTMLYFHTIGDLIEKHGFTWDDVAKVKDRKGLVSIGSSQYTLEDIFYSTHMGGFDENSKNGKLLIEAFIKALEEARMQNDRL